MTNDHKIVRDPANRYLKDEGLCYCQNRKAYKGGKDGHVFPYCQRSSGVSQAIENQSRKHAEQL
jgi:hypothetical protein